MNRILIGILGVIVVGVSVYYISFNHNSIEEASLNDIEPELIVDEGLEDIEEDKELDIVQTASANLEKEEQSYDQDIAYHEGQELAVKAIIAKQHEYLNELAGWGNAETVNSTQLKNDQNWKSLEEDIKWLQEQGFAESKVINDMENARDFFTMAMSTGDSMSVRYLHRIFHDLDALMNQQKVDRVWGVTHAFGTENQQEQLYAYLSKSEE
ncbi:hypothetical protein [Halalkalibacter alkalisediminis]|uniref:Uncharacterized protein n=1 Tax=Halalkalibacter alkalisediminis TaxID=935616 RepID=A0ABV6NG74_9BACI|nr:hypothetical protein [Halalkalibacter alkalisediminis]